MFLSLANINFYFVEFVEFVEFVAFRAWAQGTGTGHRHRA
jgi:hypothetical protein